MLSTSVDSIYSARSVGGEWFDTSGGWNICLKCVILDQQHEKALENVEGSLLPIGMEYRYTIYEPPLNLLRFSRYLCKTPYTL